jgi:hypothetical protein
MPVKAQQMAHAVRASEADPAVKAFDDTSLALANSPAADAPLALFLPGTGGKPVNALALLHVIADQGYRVIGLSYDDTPAVAQVCPGDPDPDCSAAFREMRVYGTGNSRKISNPPAEAIVARLVALLRKLDRDVPGEGWGRYLDGSQPRWDRMIVSGLSQGAGMAAFIAKQHTVRRVVLFSSPWDTTGADRRPAAWLSTRSATPPERWYAEYHVRENTAPLIIAAYSALAIPHANIRAFALDLPHPDDGSRPSNQNPNPYHGSTIHDARYADQWRAMYGKASEVP